MYKKVTLTDDQVSIVKALLSEAVSARNADNAPMATMSGVDVRLGALGDGVYVTSDVKAGWPDTTVRELAGGTLQRVAVFIGRVVDGCVTANGYAALLKFTSKSNHVMRYYLEVSTKPTELGTDEDEQALFADAMSALGFKGTQATQEAVDLATF